MSGEKGTGSGLKLLFITDGPVPRTDAQLFLNDQDITKWCRSITIKASAGGEPLDVRLHLLCTDGLLLSLPPEHVDLNVWAVSGYKLVVQTLDGVTTYRAMRDEERKDDDDAPV